MKNLKMASLIYQILDPLTFSLLFTFLLFFFMLLKISKRFKGSVHKLPPGPPKLPLIGNLHQLIGPLPHHALANLARKYGPVMHLQLGEPVVVVISSPEAAREVLKTNELSFAQRPQVLAADVLSYDQSSMAFAPYGDYWRQIRKICMVELLSPKRVQSFRSIREEEVWDLIESISSHDGFVINLTEKIFSMTNDVTSRAAFGKKCQHQSDFLSLLQDIVRVGGGFNLPDLYPSLGFLRYVTGIQPALERIQRKLDNILNDIVNEHRQKGNSKTASDQLHHQDFVDVLLGLRDCNQLDMHITDKQIKAVCMDIFSAGSETAATTLEWAMAELLRNPRVMEKTQAELRQVLEGKSKIEEADIQNLSYLKLVLKETLRLHPPAPIQPREAREKCVINGFEIPAKARVVINAWAIGRDARFWTEPDSFNPDRFHGSQVDFKGTDFELLPFGAGRRICPGISFATANIQLALSQMLYHFDWKLPNGDKPEELEMSETFGAVARKKQNLHLIATTRIPFRR